MKAFVHEGKQGIAGTYLRNHEEVEPKENEVSVRMKFAGVNHRDLFVLHRHAVTGPPLVIGSDGAGVIDRVGTTVTEFKVGDEVIINPSLGWLQKSDAPPDDFEILGLPDDGTFAEKVIVSSNNIERKPEYLSWEEAGVLPLAALTAYRALFTQAELKPTDTVLLPGIGGGAVTFLLLFAKAIGARVIVTSRSQYKCQKALELGADRAIDTNSDWNVHLKEEKIDLVIETVGAVTFNKSLRQLRKGGKIVTFGASAGDEVQMNLRDFFYGQYKMFGTTMGSREEFRQMLQFIQLHQIKPVIDRVFLLSETKEALNRLMEAEQFGKIAIKIEK